MFSFFKRLIGKSTDTSEENKTEDVADSGSERAEALRDLTMPAQPVETLLEGSEAAVRTSETQARGADAGAGAPGQSNGHVSAAKPAAATGSSSAPAESHDGSARPADLSGSGSSVDL